jgi:hypothetical protein
MIAMKDTYRNLKGSIYASMSIPGYLFFMSLINIIPR